MTAGCERGPGSLLGDDLPTLADGRVRLELLAERHRAGLRAACAADPDIWRIYPISMLGEAFDRNWTAMTEPSARLRRTPFAIVVDEEVAGMTSFFVDPPNAAAEIGGTYLAPNYRGTEVNAVVKRLMLGHAFAVGIRRIEFRVDVLNSRSRAAVEKLGAKLDGILRQDRVTWTGRVRDTAVYSILSSEWPGVAERLAARIPPGKAASGGS